MNSGKEESILNFNQKAIMLLVLVLMISSFFVFRNLFFQPTLLLKSFGELSIEPELALSNNKTTFLEFYAEWCEVCKEMAPKVAALKDDYEKDVNFVFLNVDNQKWGKYIDKFNVNGIPQINLLDDGGNLQATFIGRQEEKTIKEALQNLIFDLPIASNNINYEISQIKENKKFLASPRSHG